MKKINGWPIILWVGIFALILWGSVTLGKAMAEADKRGQKEKEECIYLKYQKDAEKFLDKDCTRYVNYKQVD